MALGTPVAAAVAYSAAGGTSVAPAYPAGLSAGDGILLILGMKPSTANSGSVTTPSGWTLIDSLTGAGGYGTTLGADTGNTNLYIFAKDTVTGAETGSLSVTVANNNVCWAFMVRVPVGSGVLEYGAADGSRTTAPTLNTPFAVALTDSGTDPTAFAAGDLAIWAMCIPTDVTTPSQFSAPSVSATGATFGTAVEFNEPDSQTGNDIGGYSAYASVTAGSSTAAPSVTVTATGTVTNVRGPVVLVRVREVVPPAQGLTPSLYANTNSFFTQTVTASNTLAATAFANSNTFHAPTVQAGAVNLSPSLLVNPAAFYSADITQTGGVQSLTASLFVNSNTVYSAAASSSYGLVAARFDNTSAFSAATVSTSYTLAPASVANGNAFYGAAVGSTVALAASLYENASAFYGATIQQGTSLRPERVDNANGFYGPAVGRLVSPALFENQAVLYGPAITSSQDIEPARFDNAGAFYSVTVQATYALAFGDYVASGYADAGYFGLAVQSGGTVYAPGVEYDQALAPATLVNVAQFYPAHAGAGVTDLSPATVVNAEQFFAVTVDQALPRQHLIVELFANDNGFAEPQASTSNVLVASVVANVSTFPAARVRGRPFQTARHSSGSLIQRPVSMNEYSRPATVATKRPARLSATRPANVSRGAR